MNTQPHQDKLEAEKKTLLEELAGLGRVVNPETGDWEAVPENGDERQADENDLADKYEDFESRSAKLKPLEERLQEVTGALAKIHTSTYGVCEVCGEKIEEDRLSANPAAKTCIAHM